MIFGREYLRVWSICHRDANLYENIVSRKGAKAQRVREHKCTRAQGISKESFELTAVDAEGDHEEHTVLRSPVIPQGMPYGRDAVNKTLPNRRQQQIQSRFFPAKAPRRKAKMREKIEPRINTGSKEIRR